MQSFRKSFSVANSILIAAVIISIMPNYSAHANEHYATKGCLVTTDIANMPEATCK